jgi:hypothetical protein
MRYCIIENGYIINTIIWDGESEYAAPPGCILMLETEALTAGYAYEEFPE